MRRAILIFLWLGSLLVMAAATISARFPMGWVRTGAPTEAQHRIILRGGAVWIDTRPAASASGVFWRPGFHADAFFGDPISVAPPSSVWNYLGFWTLDGQVQRVIVPLWPILLPAAVFVLWRSSNGYASKFMRGIRNLWGEATSNERRRSLVFACLAACSYLFTIALSEGWLTNRRFWMKHEELRLSTAIFTGFCLVMIFSPLIPIACRRHRLATGRCPTCGYDLRATPDRCPECGSRPDTHARHQVESDGQESQ